MELKFRRPAPELAPAFKDFLNAFGPGDQDMWSADSIFGLARTNLPAYIEFLQGAAEGRGLPAGWVPSDTYWVFAGDEMAGEVHVRHFVRGTLWRIGGHVGYAVQPKFRGRGVATAMLLHACGRLHELGEVDALITCWDENTASARVIEKCGGARLPDTSEDGRKARRYLIPIV
ncbi:MAG TPA: GNAT family N-acetyltransferase [Candidatus Rubrimentiphilum sp.]|nr:GNAT family N-acetyltransferase [Candidatus Rubrimentiphilum sp.]